METSNSADEVKSSSFNFEQWVMPRVIVGGIDDLGNKVYREN